jgi:hypothetical protein
VPWFLLELYVSREAEAAARRGAADARRAAEELTRAGTPVRFLRSIFVPADETWFLLFEADSAAAVREAARRAGLAVERVAEAVLETTGER